MAVPEILKILESAHAPCPNFQGVCGGCMRWSPGIGHVPRAFGGARGEVNDVMLVIVNAEPGDPADGESYDGSPSDMLMRSILGSENCLRDKTLRRNQRTYGRFHENLTLILDLCWPEKALA